MFGRGKYRIIKEVFGNGYIRYFVQRRDFLLWHDCFRLISPKAGSPKVRVNFETFKEAEEYVKGRIAIDGSNTVTHKTVMKTY